MSSREWFARSAYLTRDPLIEELGHLHGPGVVLVFEELMALCRLSGGTGQVSATYEVIAARAFVTRRKAALFIAELDRIGVIEELADQTDSKSVTVVIPAWARWQPKDPTSAERQRRRRDRQRDKSRDNDVTDHEEITEKTVTYKNRDKNTKSSRATPTVPVADDLTHLDQGEAA